MFPKESPLSFLAHKGLDPKAPHAVVAAGLLARRVVDQRWMSRQLLKNGSYSVDGTHADPDKGRVFVDNQVLKNTRSRKDQRFNIDMLKSWDSDGSLAGEIAEMEAKLQAVDDITGFNDDKYDATNQSLKPGAMKSGYLVAISIVSVLAYLYSMLLGSWTAMPYLWALLPAAGAFTVGAITLRRGATRDDGTWGSIPDAALVGVWLSYGPILVTVGFTLLLLALIYADFNGSFTIPGKQEHTGVMFGSSWTGVARPDFVAGEPPLRPTGLPETTRMGVPVEQVPELFRDLSMLMDEQYDVKFASDRLVTANLAMDAWSAVTNSVEPEFGARFGTWSASALGRAYSYAIGTDIGQSTLLNKPSSVDPRHLPDWVLRYCETIKFCVPEHEWEKTRQGLLDILTPRRNELTPGPVQVRLNSIIGCLLTM